MIPLVLVTGFLGSGKTTLLEHLANRYRDRRIVWLVNEFSARDMDASRLAGKAKDVLAIVGGSIFCRCKAAEFIDLLRDLPEDFHPESVVIEASGMADPLVAAKLLRESGLDRVYGIRTVVAIVDPGSFLKLLHTLPNIRAQIEAATLVLINKIDLHPAERINETETAIRAIHPTVPLLRTCRSALEVDLFAGHPHLEERGELAPCVDPHFTKFEIKLRNEVDLDQLREAVQSAGAEIYRIKGIARSQGNLYRLDYSASGWQIEEVAESQAIALVLIGRGPESKALRHLVEIISAR